MIDFLNNSKLFAGIMMIFLNIASKFVTIDLSKTQKEFLANSILRQVLIFAVAFVGTRDLLISSLLTAALTVMVDGLLSESSPISVLPKSIRPSIAEPDASNGPFGFLRVMSGVPSNVQNPAFDRSVPPLVGTT
jgi:hypothetical protein